MNAVVQYDPNVPAIFRSEKFLAMNNKLAAGLSTGAPPRVSFKASRYRLVAADGTETLVNENGSNGTTMDVIVLDANPAISKFYYDKKYDPNAQGDDAAPACFSEDGVAPSSRALRPQSRSCATCPMNAWGSKISESSGKKIKACSDVKKLAVIPTANLGGDAYMLGIPGASLKTWGAFVKSCAGRNVPVNAMVIRLGFNPQVSYPELTFTPTAWVSNDQATAVTDLIDSPDMAALVGVGDQHHAGPFVLEQQPNGIGFNQAQGSAGGGAPVATSPVAAGGFVQPQPVGTAPVQPPQGMPLPQHTVQAMQQAPQAQQPAVDAPAPTTRRRRAPAAAAPQVQEQAPLMQQSAPMPPMTVPAAATPVHSVATTPGTDPTMNALLDDIMRKK